MQTKTKKALEKVIFSIIGLIAILAGSLFFYQVTFASKIYNNVYFANIDLSKKTKSEAKQIIQSQYDKVLNRQFTIKSPNGTVTAKLSDTGLSLDINKIAGECYQIGREKGFAGQIIQSAETLFQKHNVPVEPQIDQAKYSAFLTNTVARLNSDSQDAAISIDNGAVKIVPEKTGLIVDTSNLMQQILVLADSSNQTTIALASKTKDPTVKTADFNDAEQFANSWLQKNITMTYNGQNYAPTKSQIGPWIKFNQSGGKYSGSLDDGNILAYLNSIAKNFEVQEKDQKINANDGGVIDPGQRGLYLDTNDAINQIKNQANSNTINVALNTYTKDPAQVKVTPDEGLVLGRFQGKYVDIDLTTQTLCEIDTNTTLNCYPVSSGKASTPTPIGTFAIQNKSPQEWSSLYGLWMPWWNAFNGNYGIHELPIWPNGYQEGVGHLGTPVSDGCVRLGNDVAEDFYNWADIGTPVYIHK